MIKQLKRRFVTGIMASALALLVVVLAMVNLLVFINTDAKANEMLNVIKNSNGVINYMSDSDINILDYFDPTGQAENQSVYAARFFYVRFAENGEVQTVNTEHFETLSVETAEELAKKAIESDKEIAYINSSFKYIIDRGEGESSTVYFLNMSNEFKSVSSILRSSFIAGFTVYAVMFVIVVLISGRAVQPIVENTVRQKQFITDAGHELKTPIAIISANAEVLEMMNGESEWTTSIKHQTERLSSLIKNLLVLSKAEEKSKNESFSEVAISDIVSATVASFSAVAYRNGKRLFAEVQPTLTLWGNDKAIAELTNILLDNAVKYAADGSKIELNLYQKGRQIILQTKNVLEKGTVVNTDRLFDRFYRSDKSRSRETGGYGIGLSIAKAIADSHKGTIHGESVGNKIKFTVTFNIKKTGDARNE